MEYLVLMYSADAHAYTLIISLYVKKSISYKVRTKLAFQTNDFESLVIEFDKNIFSSKKNIIVCIFYRSPNSSLKLFNEKLDNILDIIHREKKYCYIIGDFNDYDYDYEITLFEHKQNQHIHIIIVQ